MLAKVPSILPILIATINYQNACKGCYCTVGAWPFLAILMYAKAILSILADTILILFNTDVINCSDGCEGAVNLGTLYRTVVESRHPLTRDLPPPWIVEASHNHGHPGNYGLHTWFSKFPHLISKISTLDFQNLHSPHLHTDFQSGTSHSHPKRHIWPMSPIRLDSMEQYTNFIEARSNYSSKFRESCTAG